MKKALAIILSTTLLLSACGKKEEKMTDAEAQKFFATLEDARNQARQNAEINARLYRAESPRLENTRLVSHGERREMCIQLVGAWNKGYDAGYNTGIQQAITR